ncbi:DNA-binding IclR family transcriptional regulator [Actinoplanes campanulatus]|uniref:DNA-binding IclR family transcriptional regulator n=1 Tax=Actinoplanes campanulatus TaxID=113559 RepID=A0A7W5AGH8_9ACTN|nr:IclR family transcriptional regulator [Actinoplanes campanulatus]MBB3095896.1 DNA-binding IclR family transcriptional regulator [Actinoplanes campanulatus]GGN12295.1 IclR family transcriptional regulator [Actinoplanes campanulatus]GID37010.1 IclR family transcriptional regulator [Actinoplanes campanulatus]
MESPEAVDQQGVRSVQRALGILGLLTDDRPIVSVRDIVEATGLAKTTVLRLVATLEHNGLLWATTNGYMAGPGLWRWAHLARKSWELPPETRTGMRELAARQRETVNLYVTRDIYRVCVAQQESPQPLRHVVRVGDELPMWAGASSKVLLRDASPALLDRIAKGSPHGPGHAAVMREWIDEATAAGYGESHGEREAGLSAVAAPVLGRSGGVVAALALSGPSLRFTPDRVAEFATDLTAMARQMSERGFDRPFGSPA